MIGSLLGWGLAGLGTLGSIAAAQDYAASQKDQIEIQKQNDAAALALRTQDRQRQLAQASGRQAALYGASGVTLDGSPTAVMADTAGEGARQQFADNFNSSMKQQAWDLSEGAVQRNANLKSLASLFNFGANALIRG